MFPIRDDNPIQTTSFMTFFLIGGIGLAWFLVQGAGFDGLTMAESICNWGMLAGEVTGLATVGQSVPLGPNLSCYVDQDVANIWTPLTHMFLHGSWPHLLGNLLFFWVFGDNVEDAMGHLRFLIFYFLCGLVAAAAQIATDPSSVVPMVGASGAIAGVMGGYLLLYPRARVYMLFIFFIIIRVIPLPAWIVLIYWLGIQGVNALVGLTGSGQSSGVAFMAHVGGFLAGMALTPLFLKEGL